MPERHPVLGYAAYLPRGVLAGTRFGHSADLAKAGKVRSVAGYDEDSVTLAVEAARPLGDPGDGTGTLVFATSTAPWLDKSAAATVHAALDLPDTFATCDLTGLRAGASAIALASRAGGLVAIGDLRTQAPGSPDELAHGDAAVAFDFGSADADPAAELLGSASTTIELLERWRTPNATHADVWDERFTSGALVEAACSAATRALAEAGVERADRVVVSCANPRAAAALRKALGSDGADAELETQTGYTGAAHLGLLLADAFDTVDPQQVVLAVSAADGADAFVFRAGAGIASANRGSRVRAQLAGRRALEYDRYLRWRGLFTLRGARRPDPAPPAGPPMLRHAAWKYALVASRCGKCETVTAPPSRVCPQCGAIDAGQELSLRDTPCTVVSFTVDQLTPSPDDATVVAVVDIEGGGRRTTYVTDVTPDAVAVGDELVPTFRRISATDGIVNYFWKARPRGAA